MMTEFPRNLRYSPVNWLIVNWGHNGQAFNDCGLPKPRPCKVARERSEPECKPLPIREAIDTYDWERFLSETIVGIEDPDEDIAANYIRQAAIDFARRGRVLQREIFIPLQPGVCTYPLEPYDDEDIIGVIGVAIDEDEPCGCKNNCTATWPSGLEFRADIARKQVTLHDGPNSCGACDDRSILRILVWSAPTEDACAYDVFLYDHFREAITMKARHDYIINLHYKDRDLLRVRPSLDTYELKVLSAKKQATMGHSMTSRPQGHAMWGRSQLRTRRLF